MSTMPYPTPQQVFQMQFDSVRRDEVVGVLLAFFLGCFGIHHFYLNRVGLGILYCCFCWTGVPAVLGVIECFFMPGRVRIYNAAQATALAAALGIALPGYGGYPGWAGSNWTAPGYGYSQPIHASFQTDSATAAIQPALVACHTCYQTNPTGVNFCSNCGKCLA